MDAERTALDLNRRQFGKLAGAAGLALGVSPAALRSALAQEAGCIVTVEEHLTAKNRLDGAPQDMC